VAEAIAAASWLSEEDLAAHRSEWVEPLRVGYRGLEVCELPPNGQGAAALVAFGLLDGIDAPVLTEVVEAVRLGLADAYAHVADEPLPDFVLDPARLAALRSSTTYLCCVDEDRNAVSFIQSLSDHFGSGVVAGDTGVVLQNRGSGFVEEPGHPNELRPARRPFHTIIPGMLLEGGRLLGPFGVMAGAMQAQGHVQLVHRLREGADPQAALDAARFRVEDGRCVALEPGLWERADELRRAGNEPYLDPEPHDFGVGQAILVLGDALVGGSDSRGDGHAAGL
jgi:gamma-glutamyltranspeptidase/glutathione hydrolase